MWRRASQRAVAAGRLAAGRLAGARADTRLRLLAAAVTAAVPVLTVAASMGEDSDRARITVTRLAQESSGLKSSSSSESLEGEPIWALSVSLLKERGNQENSPSKPEPIEGVEGAFLVPNVLTDAECDELVALCDRLGFSSGETLVEVPLSIRSNSVTLLVPPPEMVVELSRRLAAHIPQHGHAGGKRTDPDFINRRWRVYRYEPPSERVPSEGGGGGQSRGGYFAPHYDAAQVRMPRPSRPCIHLLPCRVGLVSSRIKPYSPVCARRCVPPACTCPMSHPWCGSHAAACEMAYSLTTSRQRA